MPTPEAFQGLRKAFLEGEREGYKNSRHTMPTPEAFQGLRKAFLEGEREGYKNSVANNTYKDFVMDVVRRYLKRFPLKLADDEEPTPEELAAVDDAEPDEERLYPDPTDY
ncbi:hypothetical protein CVT26_012668, partial [Gymnopilus dilepis]